MAADAGCDLLVAGGGVIGLVTAWRAAGLGMTVALADPAPGGGAARAAAGLLAAAAEARHGDPALLALNLAAARAWPEFAAELTAATGADPGFLACGSLAVALDGDGGADEAELRALHAFQRSLGLASAWLGADECRRLEPALTPGVSGGLRSDGDHQVDPRRVAAALLTAARGAGVRLLGGAVERVTVAAGRAAGAVLRDGTAVAADRVVLAAGSLTGRIGGVPAGVVPQVRPVRGETVRLRVPEDRRPLLSRTVRAVVGGRPVYLVPRRDGELVIGATSEERGGDTAATAGGVHALLRAAAALLPELPGLPFAEAVAGLRPATADGAPLIGPTALPGLLLATGHYRDGILLTPVTGEAMAHLLAHDRLPGWAEPFSPARFAG